MLCVVFLLILWSLDYPLTRAEFGEYYTSGNGPDTCPHERYPEKYFGYRIMVNQTRGPPYPICITFFPHANITGIDYNTHPKEGEYNYCVREFGGGLAPFKDALDDLNFSFGHRHSLNLITIEEIKTYFGNMTLTVDTGFDYIVDEEEVPEHFLNDQVYRCRKVYVNYTPTLVDGTFEACIQAFYNGSILPTGHYFPLRTAKSRPKLREIILTPRNLTLCEYYIIKPGEPTVAKTVLCKDRPKDLYFVCSTPPDYNCKMKRVWECTYRPEFDACYQFHYKTVEQIYEGGFGIPCPKDKYNEKYRCPCPCVSEWMQWTPWTASCGIASRYRLRPMFNVRGSDACRVPDKDKCCEQHEEKIFEDHCEDYIPNTNISLRRRNCEHGIKSRDRNTRHYFCDCFPGFTGRLCEQSVDSCSSNPCRHGRCTNVGDHYHCSCKSGYEGINCERSFEQCGPHRLCMNNGNCTDVEDGKRCHCPEKWGGKYCEERAEWCGHGTCSLRGICFNTSMNTITCVCEHGAYGKYCDIDKIEIKHSEVEAEIIRSNTLTIALCCVAVVLLFILIISYIIVRIAQQKYRNRWRGKTKGEPSSPLGFALFFQPSVVQTREVQGSKDEMQRAMGVSLAAAPKNVSK
ncbi:hypothetical protein M513_07614 [Trichuris suis]|uniref:EGF-like domain-containing protein n=1 Tax=Trichuris suis TaxID=68888 RepID=A0A085M2W8_9BILA|nr:hypothetical protein M513_07614 [Trichuris suis]